MPSSSFYTHRGKRLFDLACVIPGLVFLSPLLALVAIAIRLDSPGPVFFLHTRVGKDLHPIRVFKFRTMVHHAQQLGPSITANNDPRKTRLGRYLRRYKLDELPQLLNVLNGTMSLVGPRPEVQKYVEVYQERYHNILRQVKPGITDQAAIEYRDEEGLLETAEDIELAYIENILPVKLDYYERYCTQVRLRTDLSLIFRTLLAVLR